MTQLIQYVNPNSHNVELRGPDGKTTIVPPNSKVVLSDWYQRYTPRYLQVQRVVGEAATTNRLAVSPAVAPQRNIGKTPAIIPQVTPLQPAPTPISAQRPPQLMPSPAPPPIQIQPPVMPVDKSSPALRGIPRLAPNAVIIQPTKFQKHVTVKRNKRPDPTNVTQVRTQSQQSQPPVSRGRRQRKIVGQVKPGGNAEFAVTYKNNSWSISNNIGVGILSFNRLESLQRLLTSIRAHTDLTRTTVFVSDESTDPNVIDWLQTQSDIVVLTDQPQLGVAKNTNRLLHCLSRFRYGFILNDDVEILADNWEQFYIDRAVATGYHHFCFRQPGLMGASRGELSNPGGIETVTEKPHGAVLFYTNEAFKRVGFMDEDFGPYGMEHVDWSNRVSLSGLQPPGFHDVVGSNNYFKIHAEKSAADKTGFAAAKIRYNEVSHDPSRIYINTSVKVPSITVVIPIRNQNRDGAIEAVVASIRAQRFPNIEIIVVEQDDQTRISNGIQPCDYYLARGNYPAQPFTKALAFNLGVARATYDDVVLHDADMIAPNGYLQQVSNGLRVFEGLHIGKTVLYLNQGSTSAVIASGHLSADAECERVVDYYEGGSLACKRQTYFNIGGFNESYVGYGVEDCDFFERLKFCSKFNNTRIVTLIHLWHGRSPGWDDHHDNNKKLKMSIDSTYNLKINGTSEATPEDVANFKTYATDLAKRYAARYL